MTTLVLDLTPAQEARLTTLARTEGLEPAEYVRALIDRAEPKRPADWLARLAQETALPPGNYDVDDSRDGIYADS